MINKYHSDNIIGAAAKERERFKTSKFGGLAENNNMIFVPLVFETYGRWGNQTIIFVDQLVHKGRNIHSNHIQFAILREYWKKRISVQVQIVQAMLMLSRISRINSGAKFCRDEAYFTDNILDARVNI